MYDATPLNIPQKIHVIWVGDESKRPDQWISIWRDNHPTWEFRLWGNAELERQSWRSKKQIEIFRNSGHWEGVADLMRYEILFEHGGVYVDADSTSVRPLDSWLLAPPHVRRMGERAAPTGPNRQWLHRQRPTASGPWRDHPGNRPHEQKKHGTGHGLIFFAGKKFNRGNQLARCSLQRWFFLIARSMSPSCHR